MKKNKQQLKATEKDSFVLENFYLSKINYGSEAGKYLGSVKYVDRAGREIKIQLNDIEQMAILAVIKENLLKSTNEFVDNLKLTLQIDEQKD